MASVMRQKTDLPDIRVTCQDSSVSTHLIIAKSRVSSLKRISIPRLEFSGTVLLTRLLDFCESFYLNIQTLMGRLMLRQILQLFLIGFVHRITF